MSPMKNMLLLAQWLTPRSWLCLLLDHSWSRQGICADCGAQRPEEPRQ